MTLTTAGTTETLTIPDRFNGPAGSANGGYVCGLLAGLIDGPAQVILRRPPPLGVELVVERVDGGVGLRLGATTVATATPASVDLELPEPPSLREARDATAKYPGFTRHPFPTCFVCGPSRAKSDGLDIFPGRLDDRPVMAAPWIPDAEFADDGGLVRPEFVWAALDCPTGWVTTLMPPVDKVVVLGTFAVKHHRRPQVGRRHVVVSWPIGSEGRKFVAGGALWSDGGDLVAVARATWIQISREVLAE
jgi:acyl-coenzyme A thioesterase PaaI-like protein